MKFKILILFVSILLVGTAISKDVEVTEQLNVRGFVPSDQTAFDQSVRRNFTVNALDGVAVVNGVVEFVMTRSDSRWHEHTLYYYADANRNIRIHVTVSGPEFVSYTSDRMSVKANTFYDWWVRWNDTWKAGVYETTFIIEEINGKGGSTLVASYSWIVH